jgi:hypothetical protein
MDLWTAPLAPLFFCGVDQMRQTRQGQRVALRAETGHHARYVGVVTKLLALVHVRDMHLDDWRLEGIQSVNAVRPHSSLGYRPPAPQTMDLFLAPLDQAV